jgi:FAD/FMN-containing dehydrogenase
MWPSGQPVKLAAPSQEIICTPHPALISRCLNTLDVVAAVNFARSHNLLVSVKSGGHNIAGRSITTGSFTIDLSQMKGIEVDVARKIAKCAPGLKLGELDEGTQAFDLATVLGIATDTGMGGVAIGGGYGWLAGWLANMA